MPAKKNRYRYPKVRPPKSTPVHRYPLIVSLNRWRKFQAACESRRQTARFVIEYLMAQFLNDPTIVPLPSDPWEQPPASELEAEREKER
jgi:hypothetical protein